MADAAPGLLERNHFALRRLHSLTGIVPIGLFLINHLLANSTAWLGQEHFDHHIGLIHGLPWLIWIEVLFIFLPLAFHGVLGVVIAWQGRINQFQYPYLDNWRYTLQRVTAWITVVFVLLHLVHYRFAHWFGLTEPYASAHPFFYQFTIEVFQAGILGLPTWLWVVLYAIGVVAAVYHLCNGIVTFCITWGLVVGVQARKRVSVVAGLLGLLLIVWGGLSLYALATVNPKSVADQPSGAHAAAVVAPAVRT